MKDYKQEFDSFIVDLDKRLDQIGIDLKQYIIDHVCYRAHDLADFESLKADFIQMSAVYTEVFYHERQFLLFLLKEPFVYNGASISCLEFAEPGGSDVYDTGFQHLEVLTPLAYEQLSGTPEKISPLVFQPKNGETYLKWGDKICFKTAQQSIFAKSIVVEKAKVVVL